MGIEGIEELGESAGDDNVSDTQITEDSPTEMTDPDAQPVADTPTETTSHDVPGDEPVQVDGPGVPEPQTESTPEDAE